MLTSLLSLSNCLSILSYLTYDSLSLSALVTHLSPCYHSDLLCNLPDATNLCANVYIMYHYTPGINFDPSKKIEKAINSFKRLYCRSQLLTKDRDRTL
jgi:hypothetical protein